MPHPFPLASAFTGGMRRDIDRTEIPGGSAYNMVDFIPDEIQAVTGGRGGWTYAGGVLSGATRIVSLGYQTDLGKLMAVDSSLNLWDVAGATEVLDPLTHHFSFYLTKTPGSPAVYHRGYLIFPSGGGSGAASPAYYKSDGSIGTLSGAPSAILAAVYKDHTVLANTGAGGTQAPGHPQRVWFSAAGDPTTWDLTYSWWDTTGTVTALAITPNALLVFHADSTERLRGTTPPPGSDMVLEPSPGLSNVGCIDAFSVAYWKENVVFASSQGIYSTNGVGSTDLTASAGLKTYWQSLMSGYSSSWRIAGGIYRDHYIVSINNGSTLVDCLCFSLQNGTAWRFTNLHGGTFLQFDASVQEKLYMGQWNAGRVAELSTLWSPSGSVKNDADGTTPTPIIETGMFRGFDRLHRRWIESMGKQKWRWVYVDYDIRDAASDNPTATISYCTDPAGSYTTAGLSIAESTKVTRVRRSLSPTQGGATHSQMLGLKFAVTGPYASAKLYTLEGAFEPIEIGAL